jgi:hypothetical protein
MQIKSGRCSDKFYFLACLHKAGLEKLTVWRTALLVSMAMRAVLVPPHRAELAGAAGRNGDSRPADSRSADLETADSA